MEVLYNTRIVLLDSLREMDLTLMLLLLENSNRKRK